MQVSDFLGKRVLDKNAMEIGKVSDVDLMPKEGVINSITISTGELWIRNKNFEVKPEDIEQIGDYVVLNLEESEIEKIVEDEEEETPKKRVTLTKID
jgi:sporulation protein YlmC with PRC-barrel domain